jgi:hypothetical protein
MIQSFFSFISTEYAGLADTIITNTQNISSFLELKDTIIMTPQRILVMAQLIPFFFYGYAMLIFLKKRLHILIFRLIYKLKFSELWLFLYTIYLFIQALLAIDINICSSDFVLFIENQDLFDNTTMHMSNPQPQGSTPGTGVIESGSSTSTTADVPIASNQSSGAAAAHAHGNALIMTAAIAAGSQIAKKSPTVAGKLGTLVSSVGIGGAAIVAKHVMGNLSEGSGKSDVSNKLSGVSSSSSPPDQLTSQLLEVFNMTDDHLLNILKLVSFTQNVQWFLVTALAYYAFILYIPIEKLESYYHRFLPKRVAVLVIKSIARFKKSGVIIVILMYIVLLASMFLDNYNLNMIMEHYDYLCQ